MKFQLVIVTVICLCTSLLGSGCSALVPVATPTTTPNNTDTPIPTNTETPTPIPPTATNTKKPPTKTLTPLPTEPPLIGNWFARTEVGFLIYFTVEENSNGDFVITNFRLPKFNWNCGGTRLSIWTNPSPDLKIFDNLFLAVGNEMMLSGRVINPDQIDGQLIITSPKIVTQCGQINITWQAQPR